MASMDNLRDKIRSRRADTSDLDISTAPAAAQVESDFFEAKSTGHTDSLISEIFAEERLAPSFDDLAEPKKHAQSSRSAEPKSVKQQAEPKEKKAFELPFAKRFKQLEVNRKMLFISLGVAAIASFLSVAYLKGIAEPLKGQSKMVKVIALKKDVPARTPLSEDMLEIKEVPAAYLPEGALTYQENMKLLGQVTLTTLYKGEVIHSKRISLPNEESGISAVIPDKHRAMTVRTNNAALIHPSNRERKEYIDLIASIPDPNPARQGKLITYPILQRAMVLAVGNQLADADSQASIAPSNTITLAVPEDRVNLMVMLEEKGNFKVIPRSPDDESTTPEKYTIQEIEDALQGRFEAAATTTADKPETPEKTEAPAPVKQAPLVDLSGGGGAPARSYSAPARSYTPPARSTYRAPTRSTYRAPVRSAPRAAAPAPAAASGGGRRHHTTMPRMTIQGGSTTGSH